MEPRYSDSDFDDRDMSIEGQDFQQLELCTMCFDAVYRTRHMFKYDSEISLWRKIDKGITSGDIPPEWIASRCEQAKKYHWGLLTLMKFILNTGQMDEWIAKNYRHVSGGVARQEERGVARQG